MHDNVRELARDHLICKINVLQIFFSVERFERNSLGKYKKKIRYAQIYIVNKKSNQLPLQ